MTRRKTKKRIEPTGDSEGDDSDHATIRESSVDNDHEQNRADSSSDSDEESGQGDATAVFRQESDEESEDGASDVDPRLSDDPVAVPAISGGSEALTFDLRNLLALNTHQIAHKAVYNSSSEAFGNDDENIDIPLEQKDLAVDEAFLLEKASDSCAKLVKALWQLPMEQSDAGPMVTLPSHGEVQLPRSLPPPPPKQETKWEKFAKAKGISLNKEKRSRKVWDEVTGQWMYRTGYEKANDSARDWPIMEVGANDDPFDDPWEKARDVKKANKNKNIESRMRNAERAGELQRGTTTRVMKSMERQRKAGKTGGNADRDRPLPTGVPVDLKEQSSQAKLRGKESTMRALMATQRSTASLGKFDKMREGEPERKKVLSKLKKRKLELSTDKKVTQTEGERGLKILKAVINGGGAEKERARKKGALATGVTAYDYEFNDGLGPSTFKKKKGRAGMGKNKKMTKKRAK